MKRWRIPTAILAIALIVSLLGTFIRNGEPRHEGRKLSDWISMYMIPSERVLAPKQQRQSVDRAVRTIGTNAIPYLLEWCAYDKYYREQKADAVYNTLPRNIRTNQIVTRLLYADAKERRSICALMALAALDAKVLESSPEFTRFCTETNLD